MRRAVPLVVLAVLSAGCGHAKTRTAAETTISVATQTTTSTTTPKPPPVGGAHVVIYLLRDGKVAPVERSVGLTPQIATEALQALGQGPTSSETQSGLTTSYNGGVTLTGISDGVAHIQTATDLTHAALAQVVYTLTQFSTVHSVSAARTIGSGPLTRGDFEDVTPSILVESPLPGELVHSPLRVRGTANTFEATFTLEVRSATNQVFSRETVTATSGSGTRGTFDTTISFTAKGPISLVAYEPSAENGKPLHLVRIPLVGD